MKKKVGVLLIASAMLLGSCGLLPGNNSSTPADEPATSEQQPVESSEEQVVVDFVALAKKALAGVFTTYSTLASTGAAGDFDLTTETSRMAEDDNKYTFVISYTIDAAYAKYMEISADGKKVIVSTPNSLAGGADVQAAIKASIALKDKPGEVLAEDSFNVLVKAVAKMTLGYIYSLQDDGETLVVANKSAVAFNAMYVGTYPEQGAIFADGEHAILVYKTYVPDGTKVGDCFNIAGTLSDYSGLREVGSGATLTKLDSNPGIENPVGIEVYEGHRADLTFMDGSRKIEVKNAEVTNVSISSSGNATYTVKVGDDYYTAFNNGTYSAAVFSTWKHVRNGETEATQVKVGDKVTFNGYVSFYNNNPQIVYCECTAWSEPKAAIEGASSVVVGAKTKLTANAIGGAEVAWTWSTADASIATVDAEGNVTGVSVGKTVITVKGTLDGEEISAKVEFEVVELKLVTKTVDELIAMASSETPSGTAVYDRENIYVVQGYLDGKDSTDKYGNGVLVSPTTGAYIQLYGATTEDSAIAYDTTKGGWDFKNPKTAGTTLKDINNGELVTVKAIFEDYGGTPEIMGVITAHEASTAEHAVTVTAGENGTATVSADKAAYGAEVEVLPVPAEGYVVDTVTVSGYAKNKTATNTVAANADGKYIFKATTSNNVKVTFKEAPAPVDPDAGDTGGGSAETSDVLLSLNKESITTLGTGSGYAPYNGKRTIGSYEVTTTAVMPSAQGGLDAMQMQKTNGTISIANIKATTVDITLVSKYTFEAKALVTATFGGTSFTLTDDQITSAIGNKKDAPTAEFYVYNYKLNINASAAGTLEIKAGSAGANYVTALTIA